MSALDALVAEVRAGRPILVPTDTVYGIAADPTDRSAVGAIFELKGRDPSKALPVLGDQLVSLRAVAKFDERAVALAERFWPGPLTLVLPRADRFTFDLGGVDDGSIAVRVPGSDALRDLLRSTGPLAVTSANRSGEPSAGSFDAASRAFRGTLLGLDDGETAGEPSTIVSLIGAPEILREGTIQLAQIEDCLHSRGLA